MTANPPRTNIGDLPLRDQITVKRNRAYQTDEEEYWRGQVDALNWVLDRLAEAENANKRT